MSSAADEARKSSKRLSVANTIITLLGFLGGNLLWLYGLVPIPNPNCVDYSWRCDDFVGFYNFHYAIVGAVLILSSVLIYRALNAYSRQMLLNIEILQVLRSISAGPNFESSSAKVNHEPVLKPKESTDPIRDAFVQALANVEPQVDKDDESICWSAKNPPEFSKSVCVDMVIYTHVSMDPEPLVVVSYEGDEAASFETLDVQSGGKSYRLVSVVSAEKQVETMSGGKISEVAVQEVGPDEANIIAKVISMQDAKLKLSGPNGSIERKFSTAEKETLKTMIAVLNGLKQGLDPLNP